jgi:hypothetical protein
VISGLTALVLIGACAVGLLAMAVREPYETICISVMVVGLYVGFLLALVNYGVI